MQISLSDHSQTLDENDILSFQSYSKANALDRAFNYGDGCFTTMYSYDGDVFLKDRHLDRLKRDCNVLGISIDTDALDCYLNKLCVVLRKYTASARVIKIHVSRGIGGRGYDLPGVTNPNVLFTLHKTRKFDPNNITQTPTFRIAICPFYLAKQPILAGVKHLNRLEQVMAKKFLLSKPDCDDFLMCDESKRVIEATAANVFYCENGHWFTPSLSDCGVSGVMRNAFIEFLRRDEQFITEKEIQLETILNADCVVLTNALRFITMVDELVFEGSVYRFESNIENLKQTFSRFYRALELQATNKLPQGT